MEADSAASPVDLKKLSVEELIDKLQEETNQGVKYQIEPVAWNGSGDPFMGVDQEPRFAWTRLSPDGRKSAPVVWELVRRGLQSLPLLLEHLEDRRLTRVVVRSREFARSRGETENKWKGPAVQQGRSLIFHLLGAAIDHQNGLEDDMEGGWRYRMKVGDLCYVAIGQIVNRNLHPVRGGPFEMFNVASPVYLPGLASACRKEWGSLTPEKHRESLVNDCFDPHYVASPIPGMIRLYFYYPTEGEIRIVSHLKKKAYKQIPVSDFIDNHLAIVSASERQRFEPAGSVIFKVSDLVNDGVAYYLKKRLISPMTAFLLHGINKKVGQACCNVVFAIALPPPSADELTGLLGEFEKMHGKEMAKQVPFQLSMCLLISETFSNSLHSLAKQYKIKAVLKTAFPECNEQKYQFSNCIKKSDLGWFIMELPRFFNKNIDRVIYELYKKAVGPGIEEDSFLATVCIRMLAGQGHDAEFCDYLAKGVVALKKENDPMKKWELDLFEGLLKDLQK